MSTHPELNLLTYFENLPDPRTARTPEHKLIDSPVIFICTLLCGGEGFNDMEDFGATTHDWLKTFLELPHGIPSHEPVEKNHGRQVGAGPVTVERRLGRKGQVFQWVSGCTTTLSAWLQSCAMRRESVVGDSQGVFLMFFGRFSHPKLSREGFREG